MTLEETIDLLSIISSSDRRTVGKADAVAWHALVGDLSFTDAREAVITYYRESREWIMPADVRNRVREIRKIRIDAAPALDPPPECFNDQRKYREWLAATRRQVADGHPPLRA